MADNSTSSPKPIQSTNTMDPMSQTPTNLAMPSPSNLSHSSPSIDIPQISSPSLSQISQQQQQLQQVSGLAQQQQQQQQQQFQQQQHQTMMGMSMSSFQSQQGMQRSASLARMTQLQQLQQQEMQQPQQQIPRQQAGMYGQMTFARSIGNQQLSQQPLQQQQLQQMQHHPQVQQPQQFQNQQLLQHQQQLQQQQIQQQLQQQQSQPHIQQTLQQQPPQQQQIGGGSSSQSSLMGQSGHVPVFPTQATTAQFSLLASPRQKTNFLHGSQFQSGNPPGQPIQGMQALHMTLASQMRGNAPLSYGQQQRINPGQLRQQLPQTTLTSPQKLQAVQNIPRPSSVAYMNPPLSALSQNNQQTILQNSFSQQQQQQWIKQMPGISSSGPPGSPSSFRIQHQHRQLLQQQMAATASQIPLNAQQFSQLQHSFGNSQVPRSQQQQPSINLQQQQPSTRPPGHKSLSLTGSQPDAPTAFTQGGSSIQGSEPTNQLLGKRKIQDLVSQVDVQAKLDPEVEDLLLEFADNFINSVTTFACSLAKHRKSSTLETKDVLLHLEKNWHLPVPGYSSEERKQQREITTSDMHEKRLDIIHTLKGAPHSEAQVNSSREMMRQGMGNLSTGGQMMRPTPGSDQLLMSSTGSQMLQQVTRF